MALKFKALDRLFSKIRKLDQDKLLKKVFSVQSMQADIIELNTQDQLYDQGVTEDDKELGEYTPYSKQLKLSGEGDKNVSHITLKDTGEFYRSFRIVNEDSGIKITADTQKPDQDLMTFGKILGLDEKNKEVVRQWIKAPFIALVRKAIKK